MSMNDLISLAKNKEGRKVLVELLNATKENTKAMKELNATMKKQQR